MANHPINEAEDKLVDADLRELLGASTAPDLIDRTLARIQQPRTLEDAPSRLEIPAAPGRRAVKPARWARVRYALEALALAVAVGLTAWVMIAKSPADKPVDTPKGLPPTIAAGPDARYDREADTITIKGGWFFITAGAPLVKAPGAEITQVDGQVLLRVGSQPTESEFETIAPWLAQNSWELSMIKTFKKWVQAGGTAILLLAGSALVNGERLEAEPISVEIATAEVPTVSSIKDIENLPKGTTAVVGQNLTDGHLESLGAVSGLRRITFYDCDRVTDAGIELLARNRELTALDIQQCHRLTEKALAHLVQLSKLAEFRANLSLMLKVPAKGTHVGDVVQNFYTALPKLAIFADNRDDNKMWGDADMNELLARLPNVTSLELQHDIGEIGDMGLRALSQMKSLQRLALNVTSQMSDAGFSYLKSCPKLATLYVSGEIEDSVVEQIGNIASLEVVELFNNQHIEAAPLTKLKNLRRLLTPNVVFKRDLANALGACTTLEEINICLELPANGEQALRWENLKKLRKLTLNASFDDGTHEITAKSRRDVVLPVLPALEEFHCYGELFGHIFAPDLATQPKLKELWLYRWGIWANKAESTPTLAAIAKLTNLEVLLLNLPSAPKDAGIDWTPLKELKSLKTLRAVNLPAGLKKVLAEMPNCKVVSE